MKKILFLIFITFLCTLAGFAATWQTKEETVLDDFGDPVKLYDYYSYHGRDFEIMLYYDSQNFTKGFIVFEDEDFDTQKKNPNQTNTRWNNLETDLSLICTISVKDESSKTTSFSTKYEKDGDTLRVELDNKTVMGLVNVFRANDEIKLIAKDKNSFVHNFGTISTSNFTKNIRCVKGHNIKDGECMVCHYKVSTISDKDFVRVEGGVFTLGNSSDSDNRATQVTVSSFYICDHEVTQGEYELVMGKNPARGCGEGENFPVYNVSWYDAVQYCNKLSKLKGLEEYYNINGSVVTLNTQANGYRLPTEAEWEYAARGGKKSQGYSYSGSNNLNDVAWYEKNSGDSSHMVKTKKPNELGLYDMTGNLWEWVWDWYSSLGYKSETNPTGPFSGSDRVHRGGSWDDSDAGDFSPFDRDDDDPDDRDDDLGFRVARSCLD